MSTLQINAKVLFGLSHSHATDKIRYCCEDNELALLILRRRSETADDIASASSVHIVTDTIADTNAAYEPMEKLEALTAEEEEIKEGEPETAEKV